MTIFLSVLTENFRDRFSHEWNPSKTAKLTLFAEHHTDQKVRLWVFDPFFRASRRELLQSDALFLSADKKLLFDHLLLRCYSSFFFRFLFFIFWWVCGVGSGLGCVFWYHFSASHMPISQITCHFTASASSDICTVTQFCHSPSFVLSLSLSHAPFKRVNDPLKSTSEFVCITNIYRFVWIPNCFK